MARTQQGIPLEQVVGTMGGTKYGYDKEGKPFLTKEPNLSGRAPAQKLENFSLETLDGVLLRPLKTAEMSFDAAFAEMAKDRKAMAEVHEMDGTIGDGLEDDQYR